MPWQDVRSVRPSVTRQYCVKRLYIHSKFFYRHSSFSTPNVMATLRQGPLMGASNARGYEKITIFDQYIALSRNTCKIEP